MAGVRGDVDWAHAGELIASIKAAAANLIMVLPLIGISPTCRFSGSSRLRSHSLIWSLLVLLGANSAAPRYRALAMLVWRATISTVFHPPACTTAGSAILTATMSSAAPTRLLCAEIRSTI